MLTGFRQRLHNVGKPFRRLLLSDSLMLLALMVGKVATPWWIVQHGGAMHLAWWGIVGAVAGVVSMLGLSPLGDRYPKGVLISLSLGMLALQATALAAMTSLGQYHIAPLLVLEALASVCAALISPASFSIVAELVPAEQMPDALSLQKSAQAAGRMVGPVLGGSLVATVGVPGALWLHGAMLLCAAGMAAFIPRVAVQRRSRDWWRELRQGLAAKWHIPLERGWTFVNFLTSTFFMPAVGMLLPLKVQSLHLSGAWLGLCEGALSLGLLGGALGGAGWLVDRFGRYPTRMACLFAQSVAFVAVGLATVPVLLTAASFAIGVTLSAMQLIGQTHRMLAIPAAFRGRMTAVNLVTIQLANTLGPALAGASVAHLSVSMVYVLFGAAMLACSLGYFAVPGYRHFLSLDHEQVKDWYGREYPHVFVEPAASRAVETA